MPRAPSAANKATIQCFKPGRRRAMNGAELQFAESDLAASAGAYDPALWRAPLVVGHPTLDGPAYGWVRDLAFADGALEATPEDVNPAFAEQVDAKAYANVSACFWSPTAPGNPVPGVYYLRHVGFLGATPPAVLGMRTPAFSAEQLARFGGSTEGLVEFSGWDDIDNAGLWRTLRDWLLAKFGAGDADTAVPAHLVASVERAAQQELAVEVAAPAPSLNYAQPETAVTPEQKAALEAQNAALQAENARLVQQAADSAAAARTQRLQAAHTQALAFADGLVGTAQLATGRRDVLVGVLDALAAQTEAAGAVLEFGDADARAPLLPAFQAWLQSALPAQVPTGRVASTERAAAAPAAAAGRLAYANASPESLDLDQRVRAWLANHPDSDYLSAARAVEAGA